MMMGKNRGLRLGRSKVFKWWVNGRSRSRAAAYRRLSCFSYATKAISRIRNWGHSLKQGTKGLSSLKNHSGYIRVGSEPMVEKKRASGHMPKGHLAVYVGDKEDDTSRVLVPVIYFNHPLFADLLREAEMVYGFDHQGGIQIPCQKSQFENVKMRIAATSGGGIGGGWWSCIKV